MVWTDSALREYLLGSSSPEAAERVEARLLEDEDLFAALQSAEDDLFDAFARGTLDGTERARFLERYGQQADRVRFAGVLARRTASSGRSVPVTSRAWMPWAAAAVLVLAAGAVFTQLEAPSVAPRPEPNASRPESTFAIALTLGASRAAAATTPVTIPAGTTEVVVYVRLDPGDRFDTYAMDLRGAGDRVLWSGANLTAAAVDGTLTVSARIPAASLPAGSYELAVRGGGTDLGFLPLTVRWSP
jgi:hypothetical protein